jgi:hypothetical protein
MIPFLRTVAIFNAAIWLGSTVFFTFIVAPTVLGLKGALTPFWAGYATQAVIAKLFWVQHVCAGVALVHLVAEFLHIGRPIDRAVLWILLAIFGIGLLGGFVLQPKLRQWHLVKYSPSAPAAERVAAESSFRLWHGISMAGNTLVLLGLVFYLWRVSNAPTTARTVTIPRFNGRDSGGVA